MQAEGVSVGELQTQLLQKVEELTLYLIEQNKQLQELKQVNEKLQKEVQNLKK
jgi:cell division protein FtsB